MWNGDPTKITSAAIQEWDAGCPSGALRASQRATIRAFSRFLEAEGGPSLPLDDFTDHRRAEHRTARALATPMPTEIAEPVRRIVNAVGTKRRVPELLWGQVQIGIDTAVIHIHGEGRHVTVPMATILALKDWGKPTGPSDYLIPAAPGSAVPMPLRQIRALVHYANGLLDFTGKPISSSTDSASK